MPDWARDGPTPGTDVDKRLAWQHKVRDNLLLAESLDALRPRLRQDPPSGKTGRAQWARLRTSPDVTPTVLRIQIEAATADGTVLVDTMNGLGGNLETRLGDVLTQFCIADFHVLLAGVWGLLEEDQVFYHEVTSDNGKWDLYGLRGLDRRRGLVLAIILLAIVIAAAAYVAACPNR